MQKVIAEIGRSKRGSDCEVPMLSFVNMDLNGDWALNLKHTGFSTRLLKITNSAVHLHEHQALSFTRSSGHA